MKVPIHESELEWEVWYAGSDREIRAKALCDAGGRAKVGFGLLELPPGSDTRPGHYHSLEEEHLYVLSGAATLHLGSRTFPLRAGSYVSFPAGQAEAHYIRNETDGVFRYLMVGERIAADRVHHVEG